jgi:hypothetical protein
MRSRAIIARKGAPDHSRPGPQFGIVISGQRPEASSQRRVGHDCATMPCVRVLRCQRPGSSHAMPETRKLAAIGILMRNMTQFLLAGRALTINPNLAVAGNPQTALQHFERQVRLSPLDPVIKGFATGGAALALSAAHDASAGQHWRLANKACIVDLPDEKVCHVGARDRPRAPIASID